MNRFAAALVTCLALPLAAAAQERPQDRWNLADLYPAVAGWNEDAARLEQQVGQLGSCKGKLGESARRLKECLDPFYANLKEASVHAKVRKYPDAFARAMDANNLPLAVYDALVKGANESLPTLHRYFKLRGRILGIADMRYYDLAPPLVSGGRKYPIDEGVRIMLDSVKPLGPEYVAAMAAGVKNRWMDVYPRDKKLSGAHAFGAAYDVHPYLMLNYSDNYAAVSTLAHEWGHAMHSYLSNKGQPFATASYATFTAEIASTANEALLLDHVLKIAQNDDERLLYLGSALETLRATFFRQVMLAEFEREAHARVTKGETMTAEKATAINADIMRLARERYLKLLSSGGSDHPYELVKAAGVDLASPAPYTAVATRMNGIMDQIEAILARRGK